MRTVAERAHLEYSSMVIPGELPDLNTYIRAERSNRYAAAALKKKAEARIAIFIRKSGLRPFSDPVYLRYRWCCKNKRKDLDNVAFAQKFVADALVRAGILRGDGWKDLLGFAHAFCVDKANPRVVVSIWAMRKGALQQVFRRGFDDGPIWENLQER